jgi:hypothetical protein
MTSVAIRLNENELDYLKKIAQENKICKKGNDISIGKTIKELIRWCELNKRGNDTKTTKCIKFLP